MGVPAPAAASFLCLAEVRLLQLLLLVLIRCIAGAAGRLIIINRERPGAPGEAGASRRHAVFIVGREQLQVDRYNTCKPKP